MPSPDRGHPSTEVAAIHTTVTAADPEITRRLRGVSKAAGASLAVLGVTVLLGWLLDVPLLKSLSPNLASMKANAALAFLAAGLSLVALGTADRSRRAGHVATALAGTVTVVGLLTLIEYALGWDLEIDELLFRDTRSVQTMDPGRMAPTTAACFSGVGIALLVVDSRWRRAAPVLSVAVMITAVTAALGYLYGVSSLYRVSAFNGMALHTALGLIVASVAIMLSRPERAPLVTSASAGGVVVRRMVPTAAVVMVVLGEIGIAGQHAGYYGTEFGLSLMVIGSVVVLSGAIWRVARPLERSDRERSQAIDALRLLNRELEDRIAERTAELVGSEERFRALTGTAVDAIVSADDAGNIVYANSAAEAMFGYSGAELNGRALTMLMPERFHDAQRGGLARYLATGEPHVIGTAVELAGQRRDGGEFPLQLSLSTWRTGERTFFTGILRDLTGAKRVEEARLVQEASLALVAEAARVVALAADLPAAVEAFGELVRSRVEFDRLSFNLRAQDTIFQVLAVWGPEGWRFPEGQRISVASESHWASYRAGRAAWSEDTAATDVEPVDRDLHARGIRSYVSVPILTTGEVRFLVNFTSTKPRAFSIESVHLFEALVRGTAGAFNTLVLLDQEREVADGLRHLDTLKSEFVGIVAHDLRAPMTVISGFASMLRDNWATLDDTQRGDFLDRIYVNTRRLSDLVGDVLEVARIESGLFDYNLRAFDLGEMVRRTVTEMLAAEPDRSCTLGVPDALPPAVGDEPRCWRVLTNLVSNALKFSPPGTPIEVTATATATGDEIEVAVHDHGPGIAPRDLGKLFQKFSRLPQQGDGNKPSGTGLGLYICKGIIDGQHGRMWVESAPGAGSTFFFTLPAAEADNEGRRTTHTSA